MSGIPQYEAFAEMFHAISQPSRIELVRLLVGHPEGMATVDIRKITGTSTATLTLQLGILAKAGITSRSRRKNNIVHRLTPQGYDLLRTFVKKGFRTV